MRLSDKGSLSEGAVERSETEGVKKAISNYKNSLSHFSAKNDSPLKDGAEAQIEFDIKFGQGRALSLRYNIKFNFIITVSRYIYVNFHGGSKPPPYREPYKL